MLHQFQRHFPKTDPMSEFASLLKVQIKAYPEYEQAIMSKACSERLKEKIAGSKIGDFVVAIGPHPEKDYFDLKEGLLYLLKVCTKQAHRSKTTKIALHIDGKGIYSF